MIIEIKIAVAFGKEEHDVITGEEKFVESKRYTRLYKVFLDSISHWNSADEEDKVTEIHLNSGFTIPVELSCAEFEKLLIEKLEFHKNDLEEELTLREQRLLIYCYANRLEDNSSESL